MKNSELFALLCLLILSLTVLAGCNNKGSDNISSNTQTSYLKGSFCVDVNDPSAVIGDADYVFVATVNELVETEYKDPVSIETETGSKEVSTPYTNYKVTVMDNIKGELQKDVDIELQKYGGINSTGDQYFVFEDDVLPQVSQMYIFVAYAQKNGSLLVSGPNSNVKLDSSQRNLQENPTLSTYKNAYESQIETSRERSMSVYDVTQ